MKFYLASNSARRKSLLQEGGYDFEVYPHELEEVLDPNLTVTHMCRNLAKEKAQWVHGRTGGIVVGADTLVMYYGKVLSKPKNKAEARQMLDVLSGKTHEVITGVCVTNGEKTITDYARTFVTMNKLSKELIEEYVESGIPLDRCGAYGIQDLDGKLVHHINGHLDNVIGMPIGILDSLLKRLEQ